MWQYEKALQYPVRIKNPNPALARCIITQFGGPDGELGAANRYLSQRYAMPYGEVRGILTDVGTEELGHGEMVSALVYQLTRNLSMEDIKNSGFDTYFVDHTTGLYPIAASGVPFDAMAFASKGDPITDLTEDLAADGTTVQEQPFSSKTNGRQQDKPLLGGCCSARESDFYEAQSACNRPAPTRNPPELITPAGCRCGYVGTFLSAVSFCVCLLFVLFSQKIFDNIVHMKYREMQTVTFFRKAGQGLYIRCNIVNHSHGERGWAPVGVGSQSI